MKKITLLILAITTVLLFSTCQKDKTPAETNLTVTITQNPSGGSQIHSVSVHFTGKVTGYVKSVPVIVEWWWEDGNHSNSKMKSSTEFVFNSSSTTTKSTMWSANVGYVFLNYYWVKISWTDDDGQHNIESTKAYCTS